MELNVGDHVAALRSHNKAVRLVGTVESISATDPTVTIRLDDNPNWLETVHWDDVELLEPRQEAKPEE